MAEKEHEHFILYELDNEPESIGSFVCSNILLSFASWENAVNWAKPALIPPWLRQSEVSPQIARTPMQVCTGLAVLWPECSVPPKVEQRR